MWCYRKGLEGIGGPVGRLGNERLPAAGGVGVGASVGVCVVLVLLSVLLFLCKNTNTCTGITPPGYRLFPYNNYNIILFLYRITYTLTITSGIPRQVVSLLLYI